MSYGDGDCNHSPGKHIHHPGHSHSYTEHADGYAQRHISGDTSPERYSDCDRYGDSDRHVCSINGDTLKWEV